MTPNEIEILLCEVKEHIIREEWADAIEDLAKVAVYCTQKYRKTEGLV